MIIINHIKTKSNLNKNTIFSIFFHTLSPENPTHSNSRSTLVGRRDKSLSLIHISEPTRQEAISYAVFCLKKKNSKPKRVHYNAVFVWKYQQNSFIIINYWLNSTVYDFQFFFPQLLSLLPTRVLRLLEWVGFSGDKVWKNIESRKNCIFVQIRFSFNVIDYYQWIGLLWYS